MDDLFAMLNEATRPDAISPESRAAAEACTPYWDKVRETFSLKFMDEMHRAVSAAWCVECEEHFARGLRLGARLMLALLTPGEPGWPDTRRSSSCGR